MKNDVGFRQCGYHSFDKTKSTINIIFSNFKKKVYLGQTSLFPVACAFNFLP